MGGDTLTNDDQEGRKGVVWACRIVDGDRGGDGMGPPFSPRYYVHTPSSLLLTHPPSPKNQSFVFEATSVLSSSSFAVHPSIHPSLLLLSLSWPPQPPPPPPPLSLLSFPSEEIKFPFSP